MATTRAASDSPQKSHSEQTTPPTMPAGASRAKIPVREAGYQRAGRRAYLTLIALTMLVFAPILKSDFLWSEYDEVQRSPYTSIQDWRAAWEIASIRHQDPVTLTSYFAETLLPLPPATTHRLINLLLHLAAALLLLKVLEGLKLRGAFAAALVFALHPAVLQTLYWPGYRNEIVGLVFILASLYFGIRNCGARDFLLTLLCSSISACLHPAALALPALLALVIFYQHHYFRYHHYNRILPIACIVLFTGIWTLSDRPPAPRPEDLSLFTQAGHNLYFYLRQALLPLELRLFHPFTSGQSYNVGAANSMVTFAVFIPFYVLIALNFRQRWARGLFCGLTSFLLLLLYGFAQTGRFVDGSLAKEDHALYVALPAILALCFCGAASLLGRKRTSGKLFWPLAFSLFLLVQAGLTASYSYAHRDATHMWQSLAQQWETSWQPKAALLASVRASEQQLLSDQDMIRLLEDILVLNPDRHTDRIDLARRYRDSSQNTDALREYRYVLRETRPNDEFLAEAADFFDKLLLRWEANKARERIGSARNPQQ